MAGKSLMRKLTRYFIEGILFLVPVVATVYVFYLIFTKVDRLYRFPIPGMGFLLTLGIIMVIGFIASNVLTRGLLGIIDAAFARLPVTKMIYTSIKDLIGAFVGDKKGFNRPVAVELIEGSGAFVLGFVTREDLGRFGLHGHVAVYLPQSYNFAGNMLVVPAARVRPLATDSAEFMALIVSGGITSK